MQWQRGERNVERDKPKKNEMEQSFIEKNEMTFTPKKEFDKHPFIIIDDPLNIETKEEREIRLEKSKEWSKNLAQAYRVTKKSNTMDFGTNDWLEKTLEKRFKNKREDLPIILIKSKLYEEKDERT